MKYFPWPGWWMVQAGRQSPPLVYAKLGYCWSMSFEFEALPSFQKTYKGNMNDVWRQCKGNTIEILTRNERNVKEV